MQATNRRIKGCDPAIEARSIAVGAYAALGVRQQRTL